MMNFYRVITEFDLETDFFILESAIKYALGREEECRLYKVTPTIQIDDSIDWDAEPLAVEREDFEKLYNELI